MALTIVAFEEGWPGVSRMLRRAVLSVILGVCLGTVPARTQDATWGANPDVGGNWNTATNWSPPTAVPTGMATFGASTVKAITISTPTSIGSLVFNPGAPPYTFAISGTLTVTGTGIDNNSNNPPIFTVTATTLPFATLVFQAGSTSGRSVINTIGNGLTQFNGNSSAGIPGPSATFSGPSEGHDSAVVSAGVSVQLTPAISTYVNYDGQLGRDNYDSNAVTGGVRISF